MNRHLHPRAASPGGRVFRMPEGGAFGRRRAGLVRPRHTPCGARRTVVRRHPYASRTNACSYQRPVAETEGREMADERKSALDAALGQIERQFGKGAIMRMG